VTDSTAGIPDDVAPEEDAVTSPFWAATRDRLLVIQHCAACGNFQHYPRAICSHCGAADDQLSFVEVDGSATLESFTVVERSPRADLAPPYTVALVRLAQGPVLLSHLVDCDSPECDMALALDWIPVGDGRNLPIFRPT
jgi:uncharacterized OB-fold protein